MGVTPFVYAECVCKHVPVCVCVCACACGQVYECVSLYVSVSVCVQLHNLEKACQVAYS